MLYSQEVHRKIYVARFDYVEDKDSGFDVSFKGNIQTHPRLNAALVGYIENEKKSKSDFILILGN
eukprot:TRINITY_DN304_c0_g1_i1.p5 TRINITY_DN304_c0_g1~~TRINITY_DN304_c0_g1_i1.p5  ORF type:complete len:65 (+),score=15.04 TRINITY_DN304_c0_g1_i1:626-820(+)